MRDGNGYRRVRQPQPRRDRRLRRGGRHSPASATSTTGATGTAQYCYVGALAGTDTITAAVDSDRNGQIDATDQPRGTATKVWTLPASTQSCKATFGGRITAGNGDKATFGGNAKVSKTGNASGQAEYQDHGRAQAMNVKSINVLAVVCTSTTASIFGEATIDGSGTYAYRIDLGDNGEPGKNDTYRIQLSNGYDSASRRSKAGTSRSTSTCRRHHREGPAQCRPLPLFTPLRASRTATARQSGRSSRSPRRPRATASISVSGGGSGRAPAPASDGRGFGFRGSPYAGAALVLAVVARKWRAI